MSELRANLAAVSGGDASLVAPRRAAHATAPHVRLAPLPAGVVDAAPVLLGCRGLQKSYRKGAHQIPVLQGIDLEVRQGEFLAIVGQSGSGKSTLLHLLGTLDRPDEGQVHFDGSRIDNLPAATHDLLRNRYFGMIFQFYHLLPELSTLANVLAPALIAESTLGYWRRRRDYRRRALDLLELVGLSHRLKHKPRELSGGEMQRAAIARALLMQPRVLLADEPTGNLDRSTGEAVMQTLIELNRQSGLTIVMVTHDRWIAEQADRTVQLVEGRIAD
ncbi:MAG: ATP-binding protein [Planctomycetaceae bacterium]|nr:ATP-binding protein [Planctomycetaceae bacterium]